VTLWRHSFGEALLLFVFAMTLVPAVVLSVVVVMFVAAASSLAIPVIMLLLLHPVIVLGMVLVDKIF
jgi:hypothetical protein